MRTANSGIMETKNIFDGLVKFEFDEENFKKSWCKIQMV